MRLGWGCGVKEIKVKIAVRNGIGKKRNFPHRDCEGKLGAGEKLAPKHKLQI